MFSDGDTHWFKEAEVSSGKDDQKGESAPNEEEQEGEDSAIEDDDSDDGESVRAAAGERSLPLIRRQLPVIASPCANAWRRLS